MNLKQKTVSGLFWSFIDSFVNQGVQFIVAIILARILSPRDFGLVGMLGIFIAIAQSFIASGFSQALMRKQDCTQADYSTVFYFNIVIGVFSYFLLFSTATSIGNFYHEPMLKILIRVLGIVLIINSLTLIQTTLLLKRIDFKLQAKISLIASFLSGIVSIYMAYKGWGVWSLVALTIMRYGINSVLLWWWNKWKPSRTFSVSSFKELFSFGSKLLVSGLINTIFNNVYYLVIGKYFAAAELGYYTRADQFQSLPSSNLQGIIGRVSYPVLTTIQEDIPRLKEVYKKIIRSTMLITFSLMLGMAALSRTMVLSFIGDKWSPSIAYLQLLCFVGMFYPLHALNLDMLQVQGRSDLFLRLEVIKKVLAVPVIIVGVIWGIKAMIFGLIINNLVAYYINSYWSGRMIGYSFLSQIKDVIPSFLIALTMGTIVYMEGLIIPLAPLPLFFIQLITGSLIFFAFCEGTNFKDYLFIKEIVIEKVISRNERK